MCIRDRSNNAQIIVGFILILTFGILHGANDLLLIKKIDINKEQISFQKTLLYYIIVVGLGSLLFWIIPWFALLLFIIVSGYHFGEQHLEGKVLGSKLLKSILYIAYGMLIFSLIFIENLSDVDVIMQNLTGYIIPNEWINIMFIISLSLLVVLFAFLFTRKIKPSINGI